ncbi:unnamed protein product [Cochlearia groenlandica]
MAIGRRVVPSGRSGGRGRRGGRCRGRNIIYPVWRKCAVKSKVEIGELSGTVKKKGLEPEVSEESLERMESIGESLDVDDNLTESDMDLTEIRIQKNM